MLSEQEKMRQAVDIALRAIAGTILAEAAKYSDPSEFDYRSGMQQAAKMIDRAIVERLKGE